VASLTATAGEASVLFEDKVNAIMWLICGLDTVWVRSFLRHSVT
jgi:hypothetical protein